MYFTVLAVDFDGTLAHDGRVDDSTCTALKRLKQTGRRLLLVTGRELRYLTDPCIDLFDRVVAENGAVIYDPQARCHYVIADRPPADLIRALKERKVEPLSVGEVIVATLSPNETEVLEIIRSLGLEYQTIFNRSAVMVLPPGVNKASGMMAALAEMELSPHNVVGVGDAENDFAFLETCGCSAAVANATPALKNTVDIVLKGSQGEGVRELIDQLIEKDAGIVPAARRGIRIGIDRRDNEVEIDPREGGLLISGSSGIGKSKLATALTERIVEKKFQFCVFDPEGDYNELDHAIPVGDSETAPSGEQALKLLRKPETNAVVNTQALEITARPAFFGKLLPQILNLRAQTGHPHWLLIDEAHHLLPAGGGDYTGILPTHLSGTILITVHPDAVAVEALRAVNAVLALGPKAGEVVAAYCNAVGAVAPSDLPRPDVNEGLYFTVTGDARILRLDPPQQEHKRHTRKYAEGRLGPDRSFYFRGPDNALNLRAHNLMIFIEMAAGIDDRTWEHHRQSGDYSRWFRDAIKDEQLARETADIERDPHLDSNESRKRIAQAILRRYAPPAEIDL
jgi:hydroxymethylpyrimidine pyrophosphatase-like HAD family hydrolase